MNLDSMVSTSSNTSNDKSNDQINQNGQDLDDDENSACQSVQSSSNAQSNGLEVSPPITLLQEICSRNGLTVEYQLLSTEGSVHEPTFKYAVSVGEICTSASGQSKKKARHAAARDAIEKLRREKPLLNYDGINFDSIIPLGEPTTPSNYSLGVNETNPVGKLQEICMKMRVNPPDYETRNEKGLAHERIFYLSCTIASLNLSTLGEGRSKKLAKRQAAELMLKKLESSEIYDKASSSKSTDQGGSSLNIDCDEATHFVRVRQQAAELANRLNYNVKDLWTDIEMIEQNDVDEDLFYKLFCETIEEVGSFRFSFINDTVCMLHVHNHDDVLFLTATGYGENDISAMKNCVKNSYKIIMTYLEPLTGVDPSIRPKLTSSQDDQISQKQD